jgi:hypothetical protein
LLPATVATVRLGRVSISGRTAKSSGIQVVRNKTEQVSDDPAGHDADDDRLTGKDDDGPDHDLGDDKGGEEEEDDGPDDDIGDDKGSGGDDRPDDKKT